MSTPNHIIPNLAWYKAISRKQGLTPRCPFASVELCPRYFLSLSQLKYTGATAMDEKEDARLMKKWKGSPLMPRLAEQDPSVDRAPSEITGQMKMFMLSHFCPEVTFERYGYFASHVARYADEIDRDFAHSSLGREGAGGDDWRWSFSSLSALHYSDCPTYSPLQHQAANPRSPEPLEEKYDPAQPLKWIKSRRMKATLWLVMVIAAIIGGLAKFTDALSKLAAMIW